MSLAQTIKRMAKETMDSSGPLQFLEGEVYSSPPNIKLKLKDNSKLIIPSEFIRVAEHLTRHKRIANINGGSGSTSSAGDPEHTHDIQSLQFDNAQIEFVDELKIGDKVMVAAVQGGQSFFVIDRF